jgi:hypothetical protein
VLSFLRSPRNPFHATKETSYFEILTSCSEWQQHYKYTWLQFILLDLIQKHLVLTTNYGTHRPLVPSENKVWTQWWSLSSISKTEGHIWRGFTQNWIPVRSNLILRDCKQHRCINSDKTSERQFCCCPQGCSKSAATGSRSAAGPNVVVGCFVFGKSRVQISACRQSILTQVFCGFSQSLRPLLSISFPIHYSSCHSTVQNLNYWQRRKINKFTLQLFHPALADLFDDAFSNTHVTEHRMKLEDNHEWWLGKNLAALCVSR